MYILNYCSIIYDFDFNGRPTIEMPDDSASVQAAFEIFDKIVA